MKRESVFLMYKMLVEMRNLADKLEEALNNKDTKSAEGIKQRIIELQRRVADIQ